MQYRDVEFLAWFIRLGSLLTLFKFQAVSCRKAIETPPGWLQQIAAKINWGIEMLEREIWNGWLESISSKR